MNTPSLDWMPAGRSMSLLPAGKWWDAVKVPRMIALEALSRLHGETGAVIEDPWAGTFYWLVPAGGASGWAMPGSARIKVLGNTAHVVVPGPQCAVGPRWHVPPTCRDALTDPDRLHDALARSAAIAVEQKPNEAYGALVAHYETCLGCAHDTEPCAHGRQLRQAWVGVRWS